jgi:hypothetical protein
MRLLPLCCALLLSGCLRAPEVVAPPPAVPADLLRPCEGYGGPVPRTEGQLSEALIAEVRGRACANAKLEALKQILE